MKHPRNLDRSDRKPFFRFIKRILRCFVKKPKVIGLESDFQDGAIYICNHVGATAPLKLELYFPRRFRFWGTYEMTFSFKERWKYLAHVYFYQKKHNSKFVSLIKATLACPFIGMFYKGMNLIPTYADARILGTIHQSVEYLNDNNSIVIFPENSSDGYHDVLTEYYAGFLFLAKHYHRQTKKKIRIYNMYYCKKSNSLFYDASFTIDQLLKDGRNIREIANDFKDRANDLAKVSYHQV